MTGKRPLLIPANAFSITFGLAGLAGVWHLSAGFLGTPPAVAGLLAIVTLAVWLLLLIGYSRRLLARRATLTEELTHPITAPFIALIPLTLLVLIPVVASWSVPVATVVALICGVTLLVLGGWLTGNWLGRGVALESLHSGYYLPTVGAGLITGTALAAIGMRDLGIAAVGLGGICWLLLGSIINNRNIVAGALPTPLIPTMAIDVAPVVVAGNAWFALNNGATDTAQLLLAGFAALMVLVQVRLYVLVYRGLTFSASFWAFTFSYCAVASYALRWLATNGNDASRVVSWVIVAAISAFLLWIAVRSATALRRGDFLPRDNPVPAAT